MDPTKSKSDILKSEEIVKESYLTKQSKYIKAWRERWCVLTLDKIYTFKKEREYNTPTEQIEISKIKTVKSDENPNTNLFTVELSDSIFYFQAKSFQDKEAWIGAIGKVMVSNSKSKIIIPDKEDEEDEEEEKQEKQEKQE